MMKFPSASTGGTAPSGSSFAVTNPGVFGSRVGGDGRVVGDVTCGVVPPACPISGLTAANRPINRPTRNRVVPMLTSSFVVFEKPGRFRKSLVSFNECQRRVVAERTAYSANSFHPPRPSLASRRNNQLRSIRRKTKVSRNGAPGYGISNSVSPETVPTPYGTENAAPELSSQCTTTRFGSVSCCRGGFPRALPNLPICRHCHYLHSQSTIACFKPTVLAAIVRPWQQLD